MKQETTKQKILTEALHLFSTYGYDSVSVGQIAKAVGIKAPSLYNHYQSKQAIFDAIVADAAERYDHFTEQLSIHVENANRDISVFSQITEEHLVEKVQQLFLYSLHDETISRLRRMLTIEQFRSPVLAEQYTKRYVDRITAYHAEIFRSLIEAGEIKCEDPEVLALMYVAPIMTLIGVCDRQPEKESICLKKLDAHVRLFFRTVQCAEHPARETGHAQC